MRGYAKGVRAVARAVAECLEPRRMLAAGDFDLTFGGGDGGATAAFPGAGFRHDKGEAMAVRPDGKIVLVGPSGDGGNTLDSVAVARFDANGVLDPTFDGDGDADGMVAHLMGGVDTNVQAVALQADGKIVLVGSTEYGVTNNTTDWFVMRLNENGSVDDSFGGGDGFVTLDFGFNFGDTAYAVAIQGDGKIVVTGVATRNTSEMGVARFNADGTLDDDSDGSGFSGDGIDVVDFFGGVDFASDVIVDPDGKIVVAGGCVPPGSYRRFTLLRYLPGGTLDNTFDGDGKASTDFGVSAFGRQVLRQPDGKYVVGGLAGTGSVNPYAVARYTSTGGLDGSFGTNASLPGTTLFPQIAGHIFTSYGIARQADGSLLFGGYAEVEATLDTFFGVVRVSAAGAPDATFGTGGVKMVNVPGTTATVGDGADLAVAADGNILVGGAAYVNGQFDFGVVKLKAVDVAGPAPVQVNAGVLVVTGTDGADTLDLSAPTTTFTAVLNGVSYAFPAASVTSIDVDLKAGNDTQNHNGRVPGGTVNLGAGNDALTVGTGNKASPLLTVNGGTENDTVTLEMAFFTPTLFNGGGGTDTLVYNGANGSDDLLVTDSQITNEGFDPATYALVEVVRVLANFSDDTIRLQSTDPITTYQLEGNDGDDLFLVGNPSDPDGFTAPVALIGGANADEIVFDDSANVYDDDYTITATTFTRNFLATFVYQSTETLRVTASGDANDVTVTPSASTKIYVSGGAPGAAPGDSVTVHLTGATGAAYVPIGAGAGRYTFANRQAVEFAGFERDLTALGPTVTGIGFAYLTGHSVTIVFSEDVRASLQPEDLVLTNLTTGQTIPAAGLTFSVFGGAWMPTTAVWRADAPLPDGNYSAALASTGVSDLAGNALQATFGVDFYVFAGDANRDRRVDFNDLVALAQNYNTVGKQLDDGDFNYDGAVDFNDLVLLAQRYNKTLAAPAAAAQAGATSRPLAAPARRVAPVVTDAENDGDDDAARPVFSARRIRPAAPVPFRPPGARGR